jgi:hypothetical protein
MFKEKVVLMLGAGASWPYGYPLGNELIKNIINNINDDEFFYYQDVSQLNLSDIGEYQYHHLREKLQSKPSELKTENHSSYVFDDENHPCYKIKMNQIKELQELRVALLNSDYPTIDAFLRENEKHAVAGKTMIVYSLLKKENINMCKRDTIQDHWYRNLIDDICSGCDEPRDILNNKLTIITYNYDISLDYYIYQGISESSRFREVSKQFINGLTIKHVYGKLYDYSNESHGHKYGDLGENSCYATNGGVNAERLIKALLWNDNIKTMFMERKNKDMEQHVAEIKDLIRNVDDMIIIGFGFDRLNLETIGITLKEVEDTKTSDNSPEQRGFFTTKKSIRYLDYGGLLKNINSYFLKVSEICKKTNDRSCNFLIHDKYFRPIRSTAERITDAYQHELKIDLSI